MALTLRRARSSGAARITRRAAAALLAVSIATAACTGIGAPRVTSPPPAGAVIGGTPSIAPTMDSGCGPGLLPSLDPSFTPHEGQSGRPPLGPLLADGAQVLPSIAGVRLGGVPAVRPKHYRQPLRLILADAPGDRDQDGAFEHRIRMYHLGAPVDGESTSLTSFLRDGGVMFEQIEAAGRTAQLVIGAVQPGAAGLVAVGQHDAALVHGDPDENGTRAYGLYWSDGDRDLSLTGAVQAEELIAFARSLYC